MSSPRFAHQATRLLDGRVLVTGGQNNQIWFASAEIYDPARGIWSATGSMSKTQIDPTATLLRDGRVLVLGDENATFLETGEIYDPTRGTWSPTSSMNIPRYRHVAALLGDRRVLVSGGYENNDTTAK